MTGPGSMPPVGYPWILALRGGVLTFWALEYNLLLLVVNILLVEFQQLYGRFWLHLGSYKLTSSLCTAQLHACRGHGASLGVGKFDPSLTVESFVAIHFFVEVIKK